MSHCTSFLFSYQDEELAVKCFRRLGLEPSTQVIVDFGSHFAKSFLSELGYLGERQRRAIVAASQCYQYFLCKEGSEYRLHIEKAEPITTTDQAVMKRMEFEFRFTYVTLALERLAERLEDSGTPWCLVREQNSLVLRFGPAFARSVKVTLQPNSEALEEEVSGVIGPSCTDLTSELEQLLSSETTELTTTWKPEYQQVIEDEIVQVLRLNL